MKDNHVLSVLTNTTLRVNMKKKQVSWFLFQAIVTYCNYFLNVLLNLMT